MKDDDITIKQVLRVAAELAQNFQPLPWASTNPQPMAPFEGHPLVGQKVLALLPGRFIYIGTLEQFGEYHLITRAQNLRYWQPRDGGLGEFAQKGPIEGDRIDEGPSVWFPAGSEIAFMVVEYS